MARWIRLDTTWDASEWLFVLSPESQLAWVKLLCYVKTDGTNGRVKALSPVVAAKRWGIGSESVDKLVNAAVSHGAIVTENGEWCVTKWREYQITDATALDRKRKQRAAQKQNPGSKRSRKSRNVTEVTRDTVTNRDACHATETLTLTPQPPFWGNDLPPALDFPEFHTAWSEWLGHRKDISKPQTPRSVKEQLKSLAENPATAVLTIRHSIKQGYRGLYAPKDVPTAQPKFRGAYE